MPELNFAYFLSVNYVNRHNGTRKDIAAMLELMPDDTLIQDSGQSGGCDFLFLLDSSGSMENSFGKGRSNISKLEGVKEALLAIIPELTAQDTVTMIHYNTQPVIIRNKVPGNNHTDLRQAVEEIAQTDGATDFEEVLKMATTYIGTFSQPVKRVLFLTDGDHYGRGSVQNACALNKALGEQGVVVDCLGAGKEVVMNFLERLATDGGGHAHWLETPLEAVDKFKEMISSARNTMMSNIRLQLEFPPSSRNIEIFATHPSTRYHTPDAIAGPGGLTTVAVPPFAMEDSCQFVFRLDVDLATTPGTANQLLAMARIHYDIPSRGLRNQSMETPVYLALTDGAPSEQVDSGVTGTLQQAFLAKFNADLNTACTDQDWGKAKELLRTMIRTAQEGGLQEEEDEYRRRAEKLQQAGVLMKEDLNEIWKKSSSSSKLDSGGNNFQAPAFT